MPKFKEIVSTLFEKTELKSRRGLHLYYVLDIIVKDEKPVTEPIATEIPEPTPEIKAEAFKETVANYLIEEAITSRRMGELFVPENDVKDIQTIDDLMDYLVDKKNEQGQPIMNEFAVELVLTLTQGESSTQAVENLLKKNDKVLIEIDYGESREDCVGIKVFKRAGVDSVSVMMKKDSKILPGKFSTETFNNQIIVYRNSLEDDNGRR